MMGSQYLLEVLEMVANDQKVASGMNKKGN
jgi:hypothetical protein